jgi:hypothetical protein
MTPPPFRPAAAAAALLLLALAAAAAAVPVAHAQDERRSAAREEAGDAGDGLAERFRAAHARWRARQMRLEAAEPYAPLDSAEAAAAPAPPPAPGFEIQRVELVPRLVRSWFRKAFGDTRWSFLGSTSDLAPLDTTHTRELRARLQAHFGDPSQTMADGDPHAPRDDYTQFEYWFVVNEAVPVVVTDVAGPYDRGLVVATDRRYRADLRALRRALLGVLIDEPARAPYVDYYYDDTADAWHRAGFDGTDFFVERVSRRTVLPGRRPWLTDDELRLPADSAAAAAADSTPADASLPADGAPDAP